MEQIQLQPERIAWSKARPSFTACYIFQFILLQFTSSQGIINDLESLSPLSHSSAYAMRREAESRYGKQTIQA